MELTIDQYKDALKKVSTKTKEEQYMLLDISYDRKFILPFKQAIAVMEALEGAMLFKEPYSGPPQLKPIEDDISMRPFSESELKNVKVAMLMKLPLNDIKKIVQESTS
jgi:hypothetical protein